MHAINTATCNALRQLGYSFAAGLLAGPFGVTCAVTLFGYAVFTLLMDKAAAKRLAPPIGGVPLRLV